ncbi:hypothetical protein G6F46_000354 [Rhizopus delemar]|uniref:Uncharacterized protein n=2 Tax=Rhizopus TaxID=4842 RepID=A0A9P7CUP1_9FUNG|nr:hypothetical protein G6F36_014073 [Rhizopus arrhizus]KAG1467004.1 hypothetical protein G6F55_000125 [Rhizopus delemar]KAG1505372.1 hypothetical protein G6F54_000367 [Rhizopus delemar]KAG1518801.1 hypothetical protein G6F53_000306 [Rhizopus delemar]KAG1525210.1 hypothetical protein G6F52_003526 [Rhizopus delemar]
MEDGNRIKILLVTRHYLTTGVSDIGKFLIKSSVRAGQNRRLISDYLAFKEFWACAAKDSGAKKKVAHERKRE